MSRVLVTGGGGFLGSRLVERLTARGDEVAVARRRDYDLTSATKRKLGYPDVGTVLATR